MSVNPEVEKEAESQNTVPDLESVYHNDADWERFIASELGKF